MPKGFSDHEKELIAKRLLDQGYTLFSKYGLKKTNIEDIARAAGISKGAFYLFYESKEALFMDVVHQAELRVRQEILTAIDLPGPSARARLYAVLHKAFTLIKTIPILQVLSGGDYEMLFHRVPAEQLQEHLASDRAFILELITRCQTAGIPIQAQPERIIAMLYPIVLSILHEDDLGKNTFSGDVDALLELVAAFCVGEVELQLRVPPEPAPDAMTGSHP